MSYSTPPRDFTITYSVVRGIIFYLFIINKRALYIMAQFGNDAE